MSIGNVAKITQTLDKILKKTNWSNKEYRLYQALEEKIKKYHSHAEIYKLNRDKIPITENVKERKWFVDSVHQPLILNLLENMSIRRYSLGGESFKKFHAELSIYFYNQYRLNLYFSNNGNSEYYLYLEHLRTSKKGYVANSAHEGHSQLPEFDDIYEIMRVTPLELTKKEFLRLIAEIVIYFDETNVIMSSPLGPNVKIGLSTILKMT